MKHWCLLGLGLLFFLSGCKPSVREDLVFIQSGEPQTLDPAIATDQISIRIITSLFEGLCRTKADGSYEPGIASQWSISPDQLVYTFTLRDSAKWQDGTPVTAQQFVDAWQRVLTPKTGADYSSLLFCIRGAEFFYNPTSSFADVGIRAIKPDTLEVTLQQPTPYFLQLCSFTTFFPIRKELIDTHQGKWIRPNHLIANGAYQLKKWRLDDHIILEKNPLYWDAEHVDLNSIKIQPITDANTALSRFMVGQADLLLDKSMLPSTLIDEIKRKPYFHSGSFLGTWFIRINTLSPPFNHPEVRRAFSLAIDPNRITQKLTKLGEQNAASLNPPGIGQNYQPVNNRQFDPQAARQALTNAGYPNGKGFPRVEYLYLPLQVEKNIAVELQAMWQEVLGVSVNLVKQEQKTWLDSMNKYKYQMCRSSWVGDYNDPSTFLDLFTSTNGQNRTGWKNPQYDQLVQLASVEKDINLRHQYYQQAERLLIHDDSVLIPLYHYVGIQIYHNDVLSGIHSNLLDDHPFRSIKRLK
jgi:oligopeptide transport system substrate-binding protein